MVLDFSFRRTAWSEPPITKSSVSLYTAFQLALFAPLAMQHLDMTINSSKVGRFFHNLTRPQVMCQLLHNLHKIRVQNAALYIAVYGIQSLFINLFQRVIVRKLMLFSSFQIDDLFISVSGLEYQWLCKLEKACSVALDHYRSGFFCLFSPLPFAYILLYNL